MIHNGWQVSKLKDISEFRRGSFPQPYGLPEWYDDENGFPFVQVYDVDGNGRLKPTTKRKISKAAAEKSVFVPTGTILITIQGSIGRVAITQYDAYVDRTLLIISKLNEKIDKTYFSFILRELFELEAQRAPGGTIKTITKEALSEFTVQFPPRNEQEKIAKILSTWDVAIEKLDNATKLVSGLKQNLLHKIIYKNQVHNKENWSLKPVSDLFEILDNKRKPLNSSQRQNMKGDVPYYGANGQVGSVDDFIFDEPLILLAEDGGYFDEYKTRPIAYRVSGKSWVNNHAHVLKVKNDLSFDYLYFALVHKNILPFLNGGTRAKLNKAVLETIEIPIPDKLDEQVAIGKLFNSLEKKENLLRKKTFLLKLQKQGLMQQLLTGKKRVRI